MLLQVILIVVNNDSKHCGNYYVKGVTNIKPGNFLRNSVTWEPLFHFPDEETEGEKAEGNYLRLNRLGSCILKH